MILSEAEYNAVDKILTRCRLPLVVYQRDGEDVLLDLEEQRELSWEEAVDTLLGAVDNETNLAHVRLNEVELKAFCDFVERHGRKLT